MKKWHVQQIAGSESSASRVEHIISLLLKNRGLQTKREIEQFLSPVLPNTLTAQQVGIDKQDLTKAIKRIQKAIKQKESIVVYADYDADGITAGAIMWETIRVLGGLVMPYIPHRVEEGYGLSIKGIDAVRLQYDPALIITVDHGITGWEKVEYAKTLGIEVIVTDHHVKPKKLPKCTIVHTTSLCGAGVSWFVAKELAAETNEEHIALSAIGTIADMVPLVGANRSIAKYGLGVINKTKRVGLNALISDAGLTKGDLSVYDVSHALAPRLNAMGRLEHAMDALRLLCTGQEDKAMLLARTLGLTNKDRQQLTIDTTVHARQIIETKRGKAQLKNLLFIASETYNQGVIGLVAGKLVEEFYRPAIVVSRGEVISKASARSVSGFNIVEAIRTCSDILVDVGGHPMAAGFTVETKHLDELQKRLETMAEKELDEDKLTRVLKIDAEIPLSLAGEALWKSLRDFEPFGFGNPEPVFATRGVTVQDARLVGKDGKHLKLRITNNELRMPVDAIAFGMGDLYGQLRPDTPVDIAYSLDMNVWNGNKKLQLKMKDINVHTR